MLWAFYAPVQIPVTACSRPLTQVLPDPGKLISPTAPLPVPFINLQLPVLRRSTFFALSIGCWLLHGLLESYTIRACMYYTVAGDMLAINGIV